MSAALAGAARPGWLVAALRTDHAGESGAVEIYKGILAVSRDPSVVAFARRHMSTEASHLMEISAFLGPSERSALTPVWRCLGWLTGVFPALIGPEAVFATIEAVETFVDEHYQAQIDRLRREGGDPEMIALLDRLRRDEVEHLEDAASRRTSTTSRLLRTWTWLVRAGSASAVAAARLI